MNIGYLSRILSHIEEVRVIGKSKMVDGVVCNVMGMVRDGTELRLLILLYDEEFQQKVEEREAELFDTPDVPDENVPETNRMILRSDRTIEPKNPFQSVLKVSIDGMEFFVHVSEHHRLNTQDWEHLLVITRFLNNGWRPDEIDHDIDMLFLTVLKLEGAYNSIPDISNKPELHFVTGPGISAHQVEKPVTLVVGGKYPDKLKFRDKATGEEHWAQINRVYLLDVWKEMERIFTNPELKKHMTPEQINQTRLEQEKKLLEICPGGMCFPVVEYECEDDISLQFYSKSYLDGKPAPKNSKMSFIMKPDKSAGILGLKLKNAIIQEAVPADTEKVEAELFQYMRMTDGGDIIF